MFARSKHLIQFAQELISRFNKTYLQSPDLADEIHLI